MRSLSRPAQAAKGRSTGRARERSSLSVRPRRRWLRPLAPPHRRSPRLRERWSRRATPSTTRSQLIAPLDWVALDGFVASRLGPRRAGAGRTARAYPAPSCSVQPPGRPARCPPAPRRARPRAVRRGPRRDDQDLDLVVHALRSARTRVAPAALSLAAAAVTPLDDAPLARNGRLSSPRGARLDATAHPAAPGPRFIHPPTKASSTSPRAAHQKGGPG